MERRMSHCGIRLVERPFSFIFQRLGAVWMKKQSQFQARLKTRLQSMFPDCLILKNDPTYLQGIPDLTVLWQDKWALLECKRESEAHKQPNQQYYIDRGNEMAFARFICPENEEEVLYDLQQAFRA
mgnify:CR=1 FL=1